MPHILGLQKLTLLDFPEHTACTVFLGGCNFRCPFCHNRSLVINPDFSAAISEEEFFGFLNKRQGLLDGVCITGGEPLLYPDLPDFIGRIRKLGYRVKLDTNGSMPDRLRSLLESNMVDYVAMDIKNSPARYAETVGIESFDIEPVKESVALLLSDVIPYEFRTTLVREFHTPQDIVGIGKWICGAKRYFLQSFKDSGDLISAGLSGLTESETGAFLELVKPFVPSASIRG
ncbi:MAG: anaerobic ribonucleoside-triphosphate reductase activating protein [Clostridia bacterium]|nr:anaerobic ribonucleoside-triphosphate reductase activating protein [Clostridia bacterium]MBQ3554528.1 anaerobic ribonucleoside-triphosphate reductase activating protein [Clostridia bacterium]